MNEDRRATIRLRAYRPVRLQKPSSPVLETLSKDVGAGGLRCLSPIPIPVDAEMSVELVLSTGDEPILARGRTAWFHRISESDQFDLGITFYDMSIRDKRRLSAYIDRLSVQPALTPA